MTIKEHLEKTSNDYSKIENDFFKKTGKNLLSPDNFGRTLEESVTIIIPCYNCNNTISYVIDAILMQDYYIKQKSLELIIIDDCSRESFLNIIKKYDKDISIKYLRLEKNMGAGNAREIGAKMASNNILIFIDSDTIITPSFVTNHVFAQSNILEDVILLSFRENISEAELNTLNGRQPNPANGDHRVYMKYRKEWVMKVEEEFLVNCEFELLKSTDNFKSFGNFRQVHIWSLPMMVLTCAMSVKKDFALPYIDAQKKLYGWGFNDTCVAVKLIAAGAKVIPLFNSNVFHYLEHLHTKDDVTKNTEYLKNEAVYVKLLQSTFL